MSDTPEPVEEHDDPEISDLEVSDAAAETVKGGKVEIAGSTVPKFSAGASLKKAMK